MYIHRHIAAFNARDLNALLDVMAPNCTVEGLAYSDTIKGKQDLLPFYRALLARVPPDMALVVDDLSGDGGVCVGVTWHLELNGVAVPYGRGLSFYRLNARQQVCGGCGGGHRGGLVQAFGVSAMHTVF